ncbi:hypothetical protein [Limosilactobacillus equigenerosi]|uniref:Bacterial Pleckstrin homology domain-containing protein n=1 Tax=Limosilactobacillus equigenerosi DSM 18793 = JCM 14505 TaxID=1423742 RepID=A0A0R1USY9_9LACO|nr:hypothetical protein [Limosilactobacillus equigenerosi]KRL96271.1 hypothetical protein FC21_GL000268 [Limosilactobacillus equigenerosi DSM 18793 = JCM 14505]
MENKVTLTPDALIIIPQGLDKLWALKKQLTIPLSHVMGATIDPEILQEFKGLRAPGTNVPGYTAGTFHHDGRKTFYNLKHTSTPVVIQLTNDDYDQLVLGIDDARKLVDQINIAISSQA